MFTIIIRICDHKFCRDCDLSSQLMLIEITIVIHLRNLFLVIMIVTRDHYSDPRVFTDNISITQLLLKCVYMAIF